jgi:signal transduction histidine kinase
MLTTSVIVVVIGLATIVAVNIVVEGVVRGGIEQNGVALAGTMAGNLADSFLDGELVSVKSALQNQIASNRYLAYVFILNRDDGTVVDTFHQGFPAELIQADPLMGDSRSVTKLLDIGGNLVLDIGVPLVSGLDSIELHIGLSESALLAPLARIFRIIVAMTLIASIIGGLAALLLSRLITGPLEKLSRQAILIGEGNLDDQIQLNSRDEVGNLARSFNRMTVQLKETIDALRGRNQELALLSFKLAEREEQLAKLWHEVISAQEEERKRIARELHDETTQSLAAITIGLKSVEEIIPRDQRKGMLFLEQLRNMAAQVVKELHNIVYDLRPTILDDLGLVAALRWYAETRLGARGVEFEVQVVGVNRRFSAEVETTLFRVGQEAISNIFKHAQAHKVVLVFELKGHSLIMQIKDDGHGFDSKGIWSTTDDRSGLGLLGMRERMGLCGGTIDVDSELGTGTVVTVKLELAQG